MTWITNHPKPLKGMWPRRVGCEYVEGESKGTDTLRVDELKGTDTLRVDELKGMGYIGAYVDMPDSKYRKLPLARNPQEFAALS